MEQEKIGTFGNKKYKSVNFISSDSNDIACNHCAFELGKCRGAIFALGQCYIKEGDVVIKNIYYKELEES